MYAIKQLLAYVTSSVQEEWLHNYWLLTAIGTGIILNFLGPIHHNSQRHKTSRVQINQMKRLHTLTGVCNQLVNPEEDVMLCRNMVPLCPLGDEGGAMFSRKTHSHPVRHAARWVGTGLGIGSEKSKKMGRVVL